MNIAIVLLNWNGEKLLKRFLPQLVKHSKKNDIYVIDNNSNDNSVSYIKLNYPFINCILLDKNFGFAEGYNIGISKIESDLYCLINSDVEVTENWLEPIHNVFNSNSNISIAQPKILDYNNKKYFEYSGAAGGYIDSYGYPYCRGRIFNHIEKDNGQYDNDQNIFWASGACFFIKKDAWNKLGGFDKDFFAHFEEIDLCWRAFNNNIKVVYVASSKIFHLGGGSLPKSRFKWYLNFRNSLIMLTKNLPKNKLFVVLVTRFFLDILTALQFLIRLQFAPFYAIIKANFSFYICFFYHFKKRYSSVNQIKYWTVKSIAWNYFIKNRKTFTKNL